MSTQVQLQPQHIAVLQAYERLQILMSTEATQLAQVWQQEGAAKQLTDLVGKLDALKHQLVRDTQRLIQVPQVVGA